MVKTNKNCVLFELEVPYSDTIYNYSDRYVLGFLLTYTIIGEDDCSVLTTTLLTSLSVSVYRKRGSVDGDVMREGRR